jgi:hypothetical protein
MDRPARSPLARSFERHMRAQNRSERTIVTYLQGLRQAETFLRERPDRALCTDERELATLRPTTLEAATRADLEAFISDVLARRAPSTAATYHKVLKVLYAWLVEEQEIEADPDGADEATDCTRQAGPDRARRRAQAAVLRLHWRRLRGSPRHRPDHAALGHRRQPGRDGRTQARRRRPRPGRPVGARQGSARAGPAVWS